LTLKYIFSNIQTMQTNHYQTKIFGTGELLTIKEASDWASKYLNKNVTTSNISYLIQYGLIKKIGENGFTQIIIKGGLSVRR